MSRRLTLYITVVLTAAFCSGMALYAVSPQVSGDGVRSLLLLSVLAIVAEMLALLLPNSARGSIAFIPYLASAVIAPDWSAIFAIAVVKAIAESAKRIDVRIALFNIGQHALTLSAAIWVFRGLSGQSILTLTHESFINVSLAIGFPAIVAFAVSFLLNGVVVCSFIALRTNKSALAVWRQSALPTIGMDLVSGPIVFLFAWLCTAHGPIAAAALWVPILGLREVHKANLELQNTNEELLQLMVKSIEARDPYTSGHSRRVQHYSTIIARSIGLNEQAIELVSRAALLHDVGKIYEKYAPILRKEAKLTPDEWATMQEHPIDGANLVATMSRLKDIVSAIRHHHEHWDGSGYPDGLSGEAIPLASRIISFADTIDAMTTERPYRQPLSETQVRAEILRCRGSQFDPELADRLVASPVWGMLFQPPKRTATPRQPLTLVAEKRARESA